MNQISQLPMRWYVLFFVLIIFSITTLASAQTPPPPPPQVPPQSTLEEFKDIDTKEEFDALSKEDQEKFLALLPPPSLVPPQVATPEGTVSCFDYYHFGSVQVDVSPNLGSTVPGATLNFSGLIKNDNDYPIVNGQVYMKVFYKNQTNDSYTHQNGYPVIDEYIVQDNVNLNTKENKPISFDWKVPEYAQGGDYEVAMYFTSAYRYNLLGLSFTDDVTGNKASFSIVSNAPKVVYFDKNSVKLNDTLFRFAAFPPHFTRDEEVVAYTTIINPRNVESVVAVSWELHAWDAMRPESVISRETELVTLKPNEKKVLSHIVQPTGSSVTYLIVDAKDYDSHSILNIRFVRDAIEETRINFPSITKYPLKQGEETTLFSCVHSTNLPIVDGNVLTLTLKDKNGEVIHTYTYKGGITGAMMGVKDTFTPPKDLSTFSLTARLERQGTLVEEVTLQYDCEKIDASTCIADAVTEAVANSTGTVSSTLYVLGMTFVLILIALVYHLHHRENRLVRNEAVTETSHE